MSHTRPGRAGLDPAEPGRDGADHRRPHPAQLEDNLGALEVDFTVSQLARLDEASAIGLGFPHDMLASDHIRNVTAGDLKIETRR